MLSGDWSSDVCSSDLEEEEVLAIVNQDQGWMTPIINYLKTGTLPTEEKEAKRLKREAQYYTIINNILYKRGISIPLLKCVPTNKGSARRSTRWHLRQSSRSTSSRQKSTSGGILLANSTERSYRICKDMSTMPETCQLSHRPTRRAYQRDFALAVCKMGTRFSRPLSPGIRTS